MSNGIKAPVDYLNEIERAELAKFVGNKTLFEAVRKVILSGVYFDGVMIPGKPADPLRNFVLASFTNANGMMPADMATKPDAEMGAKLRSIIQAVSMIDTGFETFSEFEIKVEQKKETEKRTGR